MFTTGVWGLRLADSSVETQLFGVLDSGLPVRFTGWTLQQLGKFWGVALKGNFKTVIFTGGLSPGAPWGVEFRTGLSGSFPHAGCHLSVFGLATFLFIIKALQIVVFKLHRQQVYAHGK